MQAAYDNNPLASVIVPTFREAANLPELTERLDRAMRATACSYEVMIVDDNSRDGTAEYCAELSQKFPLRLIVRENERGLSSAVIRGCESARGRILVVMDADLSHPPETVPRLVRVIEENRGDFALGSRYVEGGRTENWTVFRWLNSKVATVLAWPVVSCSDPMSGFFSIAADRVRAAAGTLRPMGYKIGLEMMVKCGCKQIVELPIVFRDRTRGESKLTMRQQLLYLRQLLHLLRFRMFGLRSID